jgi:hypothetical protein
MGFSAHPPWLAGFGIMDRRLIPFLRQAGSGKEY